METKMAHSPGTLNKAHPEPCPRRRRGQGPRCGSVTLTHINRRAPQKRYKPSGRNRHTTVRKLITNRITMSPFGTLV
jgi:hypothetical protein